MSEAQRKEIIEWIQEAKAQGMSIERTCEVLGLAPQRFYRWLNGLDQTKRSRGGWNRVLAQERKAIMEMGELHPELDHRKMSFELEKEGRYVSASTVYRVLKAEGIWRYRRPRRAKPPIKTQADFEPWGPNLIWGWDWTYIRIAERWYYLIVVVDYYSRLIVSWELVDHVTHEEVTWVLAVSCLEQGIDSKNLKPMVVSDHGAPNLSRPTQKVIQELELEHRLAAVQRPTGNARCERAIGSIKREEVDLQWQYPDYPTARKEIGAYIEYYNMKRPNMGNGYFIPADVHRQGRTPLMKQRMEGREKAKQERYEMNVGFLKPMIKKTALTQENFS